MTHRRRGFTLIELLVVISIIGILVGLLLPAINSAREAGRRTQCANNIRNVGLGILGYVNTNNAFPAAGTFGENSASFSTADPTTSGIYKLFNSSGTGSAVPMYSWVVPILPYIDNQELFNQWSMFTSGSGTTGNACVPYFDTGNQNGATGVAQLTGGQASNSKISNTAIGVLRCPDDLTAQPSEGNLSYAVNGGFALWHVEPYGWAGSAIDGGGTSALIGWAGLTPTSFQVSMGVCQKLGVFFLQSTIAQNAGTSSIRIPWNVNSTLNSMQDGASSTIMVSENTLTGFSTGTSYSSNEPTNWAAPYPTFSMFIGSSNVCTTTVPVTSKTSLDCTLGTTLLQPSGDADGPTWGFANKVGTFENINFGQNLTIEGSLPMTSSGHPGGANMMFCDGAVRFIQQTIDGTVYSKIITPAGSRLPLYCKQQPVNQDAFAQ
jgi:prepilin-type N-terminal cleavage/methylation domain-containing protein/prepilin-type processing-associated H-X9-DG protein